MENQQEETRSRFLIKNLLRGLLWFAVIITAFILAEEYIRSAFERDIEAIQDKPVLIYMVFFTSEVIFGLIPPEFFMLLWILHKISVLQYVINLSVLTVLSYIAGVIGYLIGSNFSRTQLYKKLYVRYLLQYEQQLKRYGAFLVLVGAVTPVPYSATCMLAGSVNLPFRQFLLIGVARIVRFAAYGYLVWAFPNWFSAA
ncbi:MAG: VTT domain-containing protein [Cyclobacteriaceae bacterium]|nr:VTT domain-containing protein [Cyclobacteriaceae bacterium]MCX7636590.1 VTT domain-containing protein [Cyclobacteriaceae bacterium]MDW8330604.1 VTT domain-containing protein [Cyclobacteriaceae bacterium]